MYYPCSENKGADQLRGYREADLRLCFRICKSRFSHDATQIILEMNNKRSVQKNLLFEHCKVGIPTIWLILYYKIVQILRKELQLETFHNAVVILPSVD